MAVERLLLESGDFLLQEEIAAGILLESSDIDLHPASGGRGRPFSEVVPVRTTRGVRRTKLKILEGKKVEVRDVPIQVFTESLKDVAELTALRKIQQIEAQSFKQELVRIDREIEAKTQGCQDQMAEMLNHLQTPGLDIQNPLIISDANDDMTQDMRLIGIKLFYTIDTGTDD